MIGHRSDCLWNACNVQCLSVSLPVVLRVKSCTSPLSIMWNNFYVWVTSWPSHLGIPTAMGISVMMTWLLSNFKSSEGIGTIGSSYNHLLPATFFRDFQDIYIYLYRCSYTIPVYRFMYLTLVRSHATAKRSCCGHFTPGWCKQSKTVTWTWD